MSHVSVQFYYFANRGVPVRQNNPSERVPLDNHNITELANVLAQEATRAAAMVQMLFDVAIEKTWTVSIKNAVLYLDPNDAVIRSNVYVTPGDRIESKNRLGGGWLVPFNLTKDSKSRAALLADGNSVWAFIIAHTAVRVMFQGKLFQHIRT